MNFEKELQDEAVARGERAAWIDAKAHQTATAVHARMGQLVAPGLLQKMVSYSRYTRDPITKEILGSSNILRSAMQVEFDELCGYLSVLAGIIDGMVKTGRLVINAPTEKQAGLNASLTE